MEIGLSHSVDLMNYSNSDNSIYQEGEKVLACYGGKWYEAKVQKVESRMNACTHFVHYLGWNKRWDEWLGTENLKKFTEEDVHNHVVQGRKSATVKKSKSATVKKSKSGHKKKQKQSADTLLSEEIINIEIPRILKKQLLDDHEFVTHLGKLVDLPRTPNVDDILKKYLSFRVKKNNNAIEDIQKILSGLRSYFDKALPAMLLYGSERKQYEALGAEHTTPSIVYGAEHLLRLFVKLPEVLHGVEIEKETLMKIEHEIIGLLKFLQKNQGAFFLSIYQNPDDLDTENKE